MAHCWGWTTALTESLTRWAKMSASAASARGKRWVTSPAVGTRPEAMSSMASGRCTGYEADRHDVASDYFDYAVDHDCIRAPIFDGMGHGLRSALLASLSVAACRNARRGGRSLTSTATVIDEAVEAGFGGESYTTAVLAELDPNTGHLSWLSAGHPEPLLLRQGHFVRSLHVDPGLPFGLGLGEANPGYTVGTDQLEPGDYVLFLTDGVTEARSPSGEPFGLERLVDLLARTVADNLAPAESMRRLGRALLDHRQAHLTDDATLLLLLWLGPTTG